MLTPLHDSMLERCAFDDCDYCIHQRIIGDHYVCHGGVDVRGIMIPSCIHCTTRLPPYTQRELDCDFVFEVGEDWIEPSIQMNNMNEWDELTPLEMWGGQDPYEAQHFHDLNEADFDEHRASDRTYYTSEDLWGDNTPANTRVNDMECTESFDNIHIHSEHENIIVQLSPDTIPVRARRYRPFHPYRRFCTP
jgi:hypothetical protein